MHRPDRYPRSSHYDPGWVRNLDMGPHPLWQLEDLVRDIDLRAGQRVLDLGCGKGASSVFLVREFGVEVVAVDLWVAETDVREVVETAGVGAHVETIQADVRQLAFDDDQFDAIISVDAFEYFGTDVHFLPSLLRCLRPGGQLAVSTPALCLDPYEVPPPRVVTDVVGWEAAAWHSPQWWQRHWELTGLLTDIDARMQEGSRDDWLRWVLSSADTPDDSLVSMLSSLEPADIGFALLNAVKKGGSGDQRS